MITTLLKKIFGSRNDRLIKRYMHAVRAINALEPQVEALSDAQLRAKTDEFKQRLANGEALDDLLPEAFAVVREAGKRTLNMRHFDVQLIGGMVLHYGKIAEMRTGEGKTLVATLPAYLSPGRDWRARCHGNDYLASRDALMGNIYGFRIDGRGQPVADGARAARSLCCGHHLRHQQRFGFDYLRDNMVYQAADRRRAQAVYAIVDRSTRPDRRSARRSSLRPGRRHHRPVLQDQTWCPSSPGRRGERAGGL
jgi:preprotein translocase subunit SecA